MPEEGQSERSRETVRGEQQGSAVRSLAPLRTRGGLLATRPLLCLTAAALVCASTYELALHGRAVADVVNRFAGPRGSQTVTGALQHDQLVAERTKMVADAHSASAGGSHISGGVFLSTGHADQRWAAVANDGTNSRPRLRTDYVRLLFRTWQGAIIVIVAASGWFLALILLLPCCRLQSWPNSYIADASFVSETTCWGRFVVRSKAVCMLCHERCFGGRDPGAMSPPGSKGNSVKCGDDMSYLSCLEFEPGDLQEKAPHTGLGTLQRFCTASTMSRCESGRRPATWLPGNGEGLFMRCGPNHKKLKQKVASSGHLYECIGVDLIRSTTKIEKVLNEIMDVPPHHDVGGGVLSWSPSCQLPRIICINVQLPFLGLNPLGYADPGCSMVALFHIRGDTMEQLESGRCEPSLELFRRFWEGPSGRLDNRLGRNNPDRSGVFKAVAQCGNIDECTAGMFMADVANRFNGKPCLITKSGNMMKDPDGEWLEISVDVRLFATAARMMLQQCRDRIAMAQIHVGFLIQGMTDDELPEGLIGDAVVQNVHLERDAYDVSKTRRL
eukprot:TRINITY_DN27881_c0_g1_i1.p1 TRINITY_DN27881_c0_g1~~TRINITY_DN27881_c0_g1_i1.p1  ORF type:complete len:583 (+),score=101.70 TRINITY_DN27881_c0_g1_i1:79-1749(+)